MNRVAPLLLLVVTLFVAGICGCVSTGPTGIRPMHSPSPAVPAPFSLSINATPHRYAPVMSSTIGIRLTPVNTSGIIPPDALFRWETTFGTFYHWGPPDFRVTELGTPYTGDGEPVYWSYFSEHGEKERRPFNITLTVSESLTGKILARAGLLIGWEPPDSFTAVVEGPG